MQAVQEVLKVYDDTQWHWDPPSSDRIWKISANRRAGVVGVRLGSERYCVKLYYDSRLRTKLRALLGWTRALRAFRNRLKARRSGIRCPQVLGHAKASPSGPSLLVMELLEEAVPLDRWIADRGLHRDLVRQFAAFVRKMHAAGISHIDFQLRNVMVRLRSRGAGVDAEYEFILVDLEDIRVHRYVSRRTRIANLRELRRSKAMTTVPQKWHKVFLRHYLRGDCLRESCKGACGQNR